MHHSFILYWLWAVLLISIGSYLSRFTYRWPLYLHHEYRKEAHKILNIPFHEKEAMPLRSQCIHCHHKLPWHDLIPLFSYTYLKGRCRQCRMSISARYPAIEILHLIICFPLIFISKDLLSLILVTCLISVLLSAAVIDIEHSLIPDSSLVLALFFALSMHLSEATLQHSILGLLAGYCLVYLLRCIFYFIKKEEGIGLGDVKLVSVLGAWLGISNLSNLMLYASLGAIFFTFVSDKRRSEKIPFGPFLIMSAILISYL